MGNTRKRKGTVQTKWKVPVCLNLDCILKVDSQTRNFKQGSRNTLYSAEECHFLRMFSNARRMRKDGSCSTTFNTHMAPGSKAFIGNHNEFYCGDVKRKENATSGKCCHLLKEKFRICGMFAVKEI